MEVSTNYFTYFTAPEKPAGKKDHIEIDYQESSLDKVKRVAIAAFVWVIAFITCHAKGFDFRVSSVGVFGGIKSKKRL